AHVLRAGALRHAFDVQPVPVGDELPVHDREAIAGVRPGVLARDRVHGVRAQRMLDGRALGAGLECLVDACRVEREVLAHAAGVDRDAGVLADEVALVVCDRDVAVDRLQHTLPGHARLALGCSRERVAKVLRDVLQRPDVEVRGRILDRAVEVGVDRRRHALAFWAAVLPALRPKTQHSRRLLPIMRLRPCTPPAISPQAYTPSSVVSELVSMTTPPFWYWRTGEGR